MRPRHAAACDVVRVHTTRRIGIVGCWSRIVCSAAGAVLSAAGLGTHVKVNDKMAVERRNFERVRRGVPPLRPALPKDACCVGWSTCLSGASVIDA